MRINGRNRLACKVLMRDVGNKVTIEPMLGYSVIRDLVVDMDRFFDKYRSIKPYLITHDNEPGTERCSPQPSANATTRGRSVSCVVPVLAPAHPFGVIPTGLVRPPLLTRTASSSIVATREPPSACKFWVRKMAYGVVAPSSTALMPAPVVSPSPT